MEFAFAICGWLRQLKAQPAGAAGVSRSMR